MHLHLCSVVESQILQVIYFKLGCVNKLKTREMKETLHTERAPQPQATETKEMFT